MGLLRFLVHPPQRLSPAAAQRAYVAGPDLVPWSGTASIDGDELLIEREASESGNVYVPWQVDGRGQLFLATSTLMERSEPYVLAVELARGKLNQVRNQMADWQAVGLSVSDSLSEALKRAVTLFSQAVTQQNDAERASEAAEEALAAALIASDELMTCYTQQALAARHRQSKRLPIHLAINLGHEPLETATARHVASAFNAALVPLSWREAEANEGEYRWDNYDQHLQWCQTHKLGVIGGPLVQLDGRGVPDWLYLWEGDFDNLMSCITDYVETVVARYRGRVAAWHCVAGMHAGRALSLGEEEQLRLVVGCIETVSRIDPETPALIRFRHPWAEHMRREQMDLSPLHFADALVRTGLQLGGIALELNVAYEDGAARDVLDFGRLIDVWSCLGVPLHLTLVVPSESTADPLARQSAPWSDGDQAAAWSAQWQQDFVERLVPALLSKPAVGAIIWNELSDAAPHDLPWGGMFAASGKPKPALASLALLRKRHLA